MGAAGGAAAGAAAAAAISSAIKASGVLVTVTPDEFSGLLKRMDAPLVVVAQGGMVRKHYRYLTSYKGLAFFTKSPTPFVLPRKCEVVSAGKIWIPDM